MTNKILNPTNLQFNMTSQGLEISVDEVQVNPSDKVQIDKDFYELMKKINPTNYQDYSKVYLIKDVINNITSVLPMFLSRSLTMQQEVLDDKADWNNLQPNSMQVFLSTSGLNAPYLASTNSTGIVFTFNLKTDEIDKMYQLAFSVGDNISFAIRGKDNDLDGAKWHYTPNVVDYDTFKGAVNDKLDDMYSKFVTGMDAYKPENLEPIIEKADKMVQDITNNAQTSIDGFKADFIEKVSDSLAQLKAVQESANKLQSEVTDFSKQKIQEINNNYDSQLKDIEKTYVADVQSYIAQVNKAQATLDDINKSLSSLDISKFIDLSKYYTKDEVNKVIANTVSGYITSTAVDTKISSAINALYTKDEIDSKVKAVQDLYNNIDLTKYYTKTETNSFLDKKIEGVTVNGADATISSKKAIINLPQPDLSPYAKITDLVKYITQEYADAHYSREVNMTQVEFNALTTKDPNTVYNVWSDWTVVPE